MGLANGLEPASDLQLNEYKINRRNIYQVTTLKCG